MDSVSGAKTREKKSAAGKAQEPKERLYEKNPEMTAVLLAALEENPMSKDLEQELKLEVVDLALAEKRFHDAVWLAEAVVQVKMKAIGSGKKQVDIPISRPVMITSQEDLDEALAAHQRWITQTLEPSESFGPGRANFKGNDLRAFSFDGLDLRSASFEGCDLRDCSFIGANLAGANLTGANLEGALLHKAKLRKVRLGSAKLSGAKAYGSDFRQISCEQTDWGDFELRESRFDETLPKKLRDMVNAAPTQNPMPKPEVPSEV